MDTRLGALEAAQTEASALLAAADQRIRATPTLLACASAAVEHEPLGAPAEVLTAPHVVRLEAHGDRLAAAAKLAQLVVDKSALLDTTAVQLALAQSDRLAAAGERVAAQVAAAHAVRSATNEVVQLLSSLQQHR